MLPHPDSIRIITPIISFALLLLVVKRPIFPFLGFMYFYYWKIAHYFPILISVKAELLYGLSSIAVILFYYTSMDQNIRSDPIVKSFYWFLAAYILSFIVAWDHAHSWDSSVYHFIKVLIITFGILVTVRDQVDVKIVIWGVVLMYVYLAYEPMYKFLMKTGSSVQMYGNVYVSDLGILSGHVSLANNMNQMIPIATFLIFTVRNKLLRIVSSIPLLVFLICLVGSKSRGGVIGFILFVLLVLLLAKNVLRSGLALGIIAAMVIMFGGIMFATFSRIDTSSTEGRLVRVVHGIEMVRKGNIFGVGPGCFVLASGKYFGHSMMSHNLYGQLIGDLGIPGTLTWILFLKAILSHLNTIRRKSVKKLKEQDSFWYYLALGLLFSIFIRLFVGLGSHSLYFFNWYVFGMLTVHISRFYNEMMNAENQLEQR